LLLVRLVLLDDTARASTLIALSRMEIEAVIRPEITQKL